jgi:murein DD-endopeptidase MepM/ murein hydrolase activator NlpD
MRRIALSLAAACALASCATPTNSVYSRPVTSTISPSVSNGPNMYASAPRAPLHSELFACNNRGSNLGLIGHRGEASNYTPYIDTPAGPLLRTPTEVACLSSGFGWRGAASGGGRQHNGLDLANPNGGFIYAAGDGRIVSADWRGGYGNFIEIDHGNGVRTHYAHLSEIDPNLRPGMRIAEGTPMGRMGMTGNATGVHLHYEVLIDGLLVDPLNYGAPQPFVTTPVTQTFSEPVSIEPTPIEAAPVQQPAMQSYPGIVTLPPPGGN